MISKSAAIYALLALCWVLLAGWQAVEHQRVTTTVRASQSTRALDIANSLAVVIRSQRRMGTVPRSRLEGALGDLAKSKQLLGIALLSPSGETVAAGGQAIPGDLATLPPGAERREHGRLIVASVVALGPERGPPHSGGRREGETETPVDEERRASAIVWSPPEITEPPPEANPDEPAHDSAAERDRRRDWWRRMMAAHPSRQSDEEFRALYEKQGLHMMVLMLDESSANTVVVRDLFGRVVASIVALLAVLGFGLAWRSVRRSTDLHVRLARVRAMNTYLHELNLAAAGLAHETRNPLNVVRGVAQVIARDPATPAASRAQLDTAVEEVDRITARLNEFIDYSKPREPHLARVAPAAVVADVARSLSTDFEDKGVTFIPSDSPVEITADGAMLRQVVFNLLLNAVQAVDTGGEIAVDIRDAAGGAVLDVRDNGPGVPDDLRNEVFRPFFSLSEKGSGLGLAVVRQIVTAHGWEVQCLANPGGGSIFRLTGLALATKE